MKLWYDFHLHSCLSPCGDADMTPYNLVNMAKLLGYDIIALTDHNSVGNCKSAIEAGAAAGIVVMPGMELCTSEEIHVIFLFEELRRAESFGAYIKTTLPPVRNKPDVFGRQHYMDATETVLGEEETLLITASSVSIENVVALANEYDGVCYPAHIDRESYSILSSLGVFPGTLGFHCAEISLGVDPDAFLEKHPILRDLRIMRSSDAHYLESMPDPRWALRMDENTPRAALELLRAKRI